MIKYLNQILTALNPEKDVLLSIVDIRLPEKGGELKIWLSVFPKEKESTVISYFQKNQTKIKNQIKKSSLRYLPKKIVIFPSYVFQEAGEVLSVLKHIHHEIEAEKKTTED